MKIDLSFSQSHVDELQLRERNVVVIDVLRSSTTVIAALQNGAREVIPVASVESAVKVSGSLFGDVTLRGGERNGKMIQGFNLGNSPLEYTELMVRGKSIIFCTTNGSVAMAKCRYARSMAVGAFVNMSSVVEYIRGLNSDVLLLCAGRPPGVGGFSLEDSVCAGMIIHALQKDQDGGPVELTDASLAALSLYKSFGRSVKKMLKNTDHGKYLMEIGFSKDIDLCSEIDFIPIVPVLSGTVIKVRKDAVDAESAV
ncbi:MAG: 2-phosphosulfolactate phosphatase [Ignavibacteriales bacterium]|nr:2-phosphosulfolactate phosphatase [Ignavibacteriales bacterium]